MSPDLTDILKWLSLSSVPVYFGVVWILYRRRLFRAYPYFCTCLLVEGLVMVATLIAGKYGKTVTVYRITQPGLWALYVLSVLEIFQKVFAKFPGIARFSKRVVLGSIILAFLAALAVVLGELDTSWVGRSAIARYSLVLKVVSITISLYMILIAAFLVWMPVPLPRNTVRHSFLYFFYFLATAGIQYVLNAPAGYSVIQMNILTAGLTLVALFSWVVLLQRSGEELPAYQVAPRPTSAVMLDRLESLNRSLSKR